MSFKVLAEEGQTVQNKINHIVDLWGGTHPGTTNVSKDQVATTAQINAWKSYLRTLNARITGNKVTIPADNTRGDKLVKTQLTELWSAADQIALWCNRSECHKSECQRSECHSGECHTGECQGGES